ncbi:hypothetical protein ACOMHN_028855 [Nucella lapillus]
MDCVYYRCGSNQVLHRQCEADITPYVKFRCENKHMCDVIVDVATFGLEMCVDVMKYAEVNYDCVQPHSMNAIKGCLSTCANPGHSVHHVAARKHLGRSKTQIPGPGLGKSLGFRHPPAPASAIASPFAGASNSGAGFSRASAAVPSPPRASYASSSSKPAAKSPPSAGPSAPALPYGTLSRSMAAALTNGSGSRLSAPAVGAMRSATARAALMNRLQRVMMALRNRGRQG